MYTEQEAKDKVENLKNVFRYCPVIKTECKKNCVCYRVPYYCHTDSRLITMKDKDNGRTISVIDFECTHKLLGCDD